MSNNVIVGQSGGPTAVINSSLAGVYKTARSLGAGKVYGMKYGIEGLLKEEIVDLNVLLDDRMSIELLKRTPSSFLGSCRYKLPDWHEDEAVYKKLFDILEKLDIGYFFYIGRTARLSSSCSPSLTSTTSARCSTSAATTRWTPLPS